MGRWVRVLLGPLPATAILLPLLFAGGLGTAIAVLAWLVEPGRSTAQWWDTVSSTGLLLAWMAAAGLGVMALWVAVLAESPEALRESPARWRLVAGLLLGLVAAGRWLWTMAAGRHSYDTATWAVWLVLLVGPVVLGTYYLVVFARR